jgi:hypothetical protein
LLFDIGISSEEIEKFVPDKSDVTALDALLKLGSSYVRELTILQLLPPTDVHADLYHPLSSSLIISL